MSVLVDIEDDGWQRVPDLVKLAEGAVAAAVAWERGSADPLEVSILFTGEDQAALINREWRNETYAPNVLSFPAVAAIEPPPGEARPLGDIVLAAGVVAREAVEQGRSMESHTAHLLVHGTLHLLGYDHMEPADAAKMEEVETAILRELGYPDPYEQ